VSLLEDVDDVADGGGLFLPQDGQDARLGVGRSW
jgi:hypothetical protein